MSRPAPPWDPAADDVFVCAAVRPVAPTTATVLLAPRRPGTIAFEAGQYVTAEFAIDGVPTQRCYTIASPPTRPERIALTVGRADDGVVSRWLHDGGLAPGDPVRVGPPQGEFTLERHPAPSYLFLTAGSGITPALSILREAHDLGADHDITLVHSQRQRADVPYLPELQWIAQHLPQVRLHLLCSADGDRLDAGRLARLVPDAARRAVFVCGPDGYRTAARAAAIAGGAGDGAIHEESFTFAPPVARPVTAAGEGRRVEFRQHGIVVDCAPGATLLDAALAAGVPQLFSCAQGLCGTCKSTLLAGEVDMSHNGGIRPREIAAGKVLLCCSVPRTDVVIGA